MYHHFSRVWRIWIGDWSSCVADLGFGFWDQEIVNAISEQTGLDAKILNSLDEHTRNAVDDFWTLCCVKSPIPWGLPQGIDANYRDRLCAWCGGFIGRGTQFYCLVIRRSMYEWLLHRTVKSHSGFHECRRDEAERYWSGRGERIPSFGVIMVRMSR